MDKLQSVRSLGKKRVAVEVRKIGLNTYEVVPGKITMLSEEIMVGEKKNAVIVSESGEIIEPSGRFLWTAETIDPFHFVTDFF